MALNFTSIISKVRLSCFASFASVGLVALEAHADLPLSIEELLADQQETRLEFGMTYANTDRKRSDAKFNLVGVGPSSYLLLPVDIEETRQNSDTVIFTFGARYGLSADT